MALISAVLVGLQNFTEDENGALAALVPGVEQLQSRLGIVEAKFTAVKQDTEALRKGQAEQRVRSEAAHSEEMAGLKRLERLSIDAAGGGRRRCMRSLKFATCCARETPRSTISGPRSCRASLSGSSMI
jgi:hypothetical protein